MKPTDPLDPPPPPEQPQPEPASIVDAPAEPPPGVEDPLVHRMELVIGTMLRWGVVASLALVVIGTAVNFLQGAYRSPSSVATADDVRRLTTTDAMPDEPGQRLIVAGLLLLLATPVLRVVVSIVGFAIQRDAIFVAITAAVLALLVASFLLGAAHG